MDVRFARPLLLPADVAFFADVTGGTGSFAVRDARRDAEYLTGRVERA